ncbi:MAG: hypothetical protein ACTHZD_15510 [Micrococcaceae bacterium]
MKPPVFTSDVSPMDQLADPDKRAELQRYMKHLGIADRGVANFPIAGEALFRGLEVSATPKARLQVSDGRRSFWWKGGWTNLNSELARRLGSQKEIQSRSFRARGLSSPENAVFSPGEGRRAWAWGSPIAPLVVKPYNGSQGRGVHVNLNSEPEFLEAFDTVTAEWGPVLVEEFVRGSEHRVHVVDGKVTAALRIDSANVKGDGTSTIAELVAEKNLSAMPPHKPIQTGDAEQKFLARAGHTFDTVLDAGAKAYLRGNSNLASGGDSVDVTHELSTEEISFVESAARGWPGMRVAGFDILFPRGEGDAPATILEMNHPAGMGGHHYPRFGPGREVAIPIINAMFPKTARPWPPTA